MFQENKYKSVYDQIIARARTRTIEGVYTEKHHILPRSLGGDDTLDNFAVLTFREHRIAHKLLVKFTSGDCKKKMAYALRMMLIRSSMKCKTSISPSVETRKMISNSIKLKYAANPAIIENLKTQRALQVMGPHTDETRRKIKESNIKYWASDQGAESKKKISDANRGKTYARGAKRSDDHRRIISENLRDHTVYSFENMKTGQILIGTRQDFCTTLSIPREDIHNLVSGKTKTFKREWRLSNG